MAYLDILRLLGETPANMRSGLTSDGLGNLVTGIASVLISTAIAVSLSKRQSRFAQRTALERQVDELIRIGIEHPELETEALCRDWNNLNTPDVARNRYEFYCCFVFNLIYRVWDYYAGDTDKMKEIIFYEELIEAHRAWWFRDLKNEVGYEKEFVAFINKAIPIQGDGEQ